MKTQSKNLIGTIIGCGIMLSLSLPRNQGLVIAGFLLFLIPLSLYSLFVMYRKKEERKLRATKLAIWSLGVVAIVATHYYYSVNTRNVANSAIETILQYKKEHNQYPEALETIGIPSKEYRAKHRISYSTNKKNNPAFYYFVPFGLRNSYHYDFNEAEWRYVVD